jgi:hypothetical protein
MLTLELLLELKQEVEDLVAMYERGRNEVLY